MDPVSAVGIAASSLQLASVVFITALKPIQLVKDLKAMPERLSNPLADAEKSIDRLLSVQSMLDDPSSKVASILDKTQISRLKVAVPSLDNLSRQPAVVVARQY